ncbi:MAG: hypothetical protein K2M19_08115 [Muribaculaceae bacterium]|nr:hypothetical protein [Muribaculaceae bacterium]
MQRRFTGPVAVRTHHSLFTYRHDDRLAEMVRKGKYDGQPELLVSLARIFAEELVAGDVLQGVDALVPVPMYWWKQLRRGYNQTHYITRELSRATGIPMMKALRALRGHSRLAGASHEARARAVDGIFAPVRAGVLAGKRVALVDDVLTSGSTLTAAATAAGEGGAVSVVTLTLGATPPAPSLDGR